MSDDYIDDVFGERGLLAARFPGYGVRAGQVQLARAVDQAIREGSHLLAEAPTGSGKSLAYCVPAIWHAVERRTTAVIATANIALQEQLVKKDLPLLASIGFRNFSYALLKGRDNYLCLHRTERGVGERPREEDQEDIRDIWQWSKETLTGDVSELSFEPKRRVWRRFSVSSDECGGRGCPDYGACWAEAARKKARAATVIVTNYHMLFSDLKIRASQAGREFVRAILPNYEIAILDEGHKAVDIARDFFGQRVAEGTVRWAAHGLPGGDRERLEVAGGRFFADLGAHRRSAKARIDRLDVVDWRPLVEGLEAAGDWYADRVAAAYDDLSARLMNFPRSSENSSTSSQSPEERLAKLDKVRKLIRLAESPNRHEAALASERAREMMEIFGIKDADLEDEVAPRPPPMPVAISDEVRRQIKDYLKRSRGAHRAATFIREAMELRSNPEPPWVPHPRVAPGSGPYARWYWSDPALGGSNEVKCEAQLAGTVYYVEEERGGSRDDDEGEGSGLALAVRASREALCSKPVSVAEYLQKHFFSQLGSASITSATLVARGSFEFIAGEYGVEAKTLVAQSPFDWPNQALLVLPTDLPDPSHGDFPAAAAEAFARVVELARGRTLGLFTSYKNLRVAHERVLGKVPYRVLRQGDGPRTRLIDEFRKDVHSVLLGVESFWAGVDVQGESLSCVFIDKLPFPQPDDPVLDALGQRSGGDAFHKYSIPKAIIALKQGFGRLIRTTTDRGAVVLLDRRVTTKAYGRYFLEALPPVRRSSRLEDVAAFLDGDAAREERAG